MNPADLRKCAEQIANGTDWLTAIDLTWTRQRDRVNVRHFVEYAWQADGGRLYDGPSDDAACAVLGDWADDQERHLALVARMEANR
jgi:hypothetical protein